jgi:hypothetical protein
LLWFIKFTEFGIKLKINKTIHSLHRKPRQMMLTTAAGASLLGRQAVRYECADHLEELRKMLFPTFMGILELCSEHRNNCT